MWSPKITKPTIGQIQRLQAAPYTVTSTSSAVRPTSVAIDPSTSTHPPPVNRFLVNSQRAEPSISSCRCSTISHNSTSAEQQLYSNPISVSTGQTAATGTINTIAPITSAPTQINRINNFRSNSSSSTTNPMLLVPFAAMPPGFVPIQGQIPVVASAPASATAICELSFLIIINKRFTEETH